VAPLAPAPVPRVNTPPNDPPAQPTTYAARTGNAGRRRRKPACEALAVKRAAKLLEQTNAQAKQATKCVAKAKERARTKDKAKKTTNQPHMHTHNTRHRRKPPQGSINVTPHSANAAIAALCPAPIEQQPPSSPAKQRPILPAHAYWTANSVIDEATGALLEYAQLKLGADGEDWIAAAANKIGRLAQGVQPHMPTGTNTIHFIHPSEKPADRKGTYLRIVSALKPLKQETRRIRFTVGGNRIDYKGNVSTPTSDLTTVKILLNSVVSTPGAKFMTNDIQDFYPYTPMNCYEYMRIPIKDIPTCIMDQYNLKALEQNGYVLVEIRKGMYGLPQAGILVNERLVKHLANYGYSPTKNNPGLFTHKTQPITFTLVANDLASSTKAKTTPNISLTPSKTSTKSPQIGLVSRTAA
jgi:hypothetical protein